MALLGMENGILDKLPVKGSLVSKMGILMRVISTI